MPLSLLDPDRPSQLRGLLGPQPDPDNPLLAGTPTPADAFRFDAPIVAQHLADAWRTAQDPEFWIDAARKYGQGLLIGSRAPELRALGPQAYLPHEEMPGLSTGLKDAIPQGQGDAFSSATSWQDRQTGRDMLTGPLFDQPRMPDTPGSFINSAGVLETNPARTAQPLIEVNPPADIDPRTQSALTGAAYGRGLVDMQEGSGWHYIDTRADQDLRGASSLRLLGPRPTQQQLADLSKVADRHGYYTADTGDGVSLINAGRTAADTPEGQMPSPPTGMALRDRLKAGLQDEINQTLPGASIVPGRSQSGYADLAQELASSVAGKGRATDKVLAELADMRTKAPDMYEKLMDNPGVAAKAQANLDRLQQFGIEGVRPDYVNMLKVIAAGNLRGLLRYVSTAGSAGLPAALAVMARDGDR